MTQAKAQTVAAALIGAGYIISSMQKLSDGSFIIRASGSEIDPAVVATFATNQSITATVENATFK